MMYIYSGEAGSGKTLTSIDFCTELSRRYASAVYAYLPFNRNYAPASWTFMTQDVPKEGEISVYDWWQQPAGSIFLFDDAHTLFPNVIEILPHYLRALSDLAKNGHHVVMTTPEMSKLNRFIRLQSNRARQLQLPFTNAQLLKRVLERAA